jgi:hypothetical protein
MLTGNGKCDYIFRAHLIFPFHSHFPHHHPHTHTTKLDGFIDAMNFLMLLFAWEEWNKRGNNEKC